MTVPDVLPERRGDLPSPLTRLVGREREVDALCAILVDDEARLLTLTGPGGVGKTRLAVAVAVSLSPAFPDGIRFVALAPVPDPDLVVPAIAQALGVREAGGELLINRMSTFLRAKRLLLVLDNVEHVVDAAPHVAALLSACPRLAILATSRVRLRLSGEREFPIYPLPLPPLAPFSLGVVAGSEAVQLFLERARASQPGFALTGENAEAIAGICRRLDGLPLAIELAAVRVKVLPPDALLARLETRLPLLTGGGRDLPTRQQTMRDTIAWSYDLLTDEEQRLFRRLAVFAGGFTLDAADAVAGEPPGDGSSVLELVASLVDKSLLRLDIGPDGQPRQSMLETVREYGLDQLNMEGEAITVRARHSAWGLALAERAALEMDGPHQGRWLAQMEAEHDNLRSALVWLRESRNAEDGLRLGTALAPFWLRRGHLAEGRGQLRGLLTLPLLAEHTRQQADALIAEASLAAAQGDDAGGEEAGEAALALWRELGDQRGAARTLSHLAMVTKSVERETRLAAESLDLFRAAGDRRSLAMAMADVGGLVRDRGDLAQAQRLVRESVALFRELGDTIGIAWPLANLGLIDLYGGDYRGASTLLAESAAQFRAAGDLRGLTWVIHSQGLVAWGQGELVRAMALHEEALVLARQTGDRAETTYLIVCMGYVAEDASEFEQARERYRSALPTYQELDRKWGVARCLEGLAGLALAGGDAAGAVRILGTATALREAQALPVPPIFRARRDRLIARSRTTLGSVAFSAAWEVGQGTALGDAIRALLRDPLAPDAPERTPKVEPTAGFGLTPREHEVLTLLAAGKADREIGEALFIGTRTVQTHVANVFAKLGVNARAEAAAVAVRRGLV